MEKAQMLRSAKHKLTVAVCLSSFAILFCAQAFAHYKIVKFPKRSIGTCCFIKQGHQPGLRASTDFEAKGTVKVPLDQGIAIKINYELSENFSPLKQIDPKVFIRFNANEFPLSDKELSVLSGMTNLESLNVSRTDFSDGSVEFLRGMKNLLHLDARCSLITSKGVGKICKYCPDINTLNLGKNELDDSAIVSLSKLKNLSQLNLNSCGLRGTNLELLAKSPKLTTLNLANNKINDRFVGKLAAIKSLEELELMDNPVGFLGIKQLKPLTKLREITLRTKSFSHDELKKMRNTCLPATCRIKDGSRSSEMPDELFAPLHSPFKKGDGIENR